jgi:sugar lactone lactonase YvrE
MKHHNRVGLNKRAALVTIGLLLPLVGVSAASAHDDATPIVVENVGFQTPESVLYDRADDVYLVSNINGGGVAADNNGFISRVSPNGTVLDLKWIEGGKNGVTLDGPKGSAIANGTLYVADITNLRKFDARTGAPTGSISFPNATFLNDVASDNRGNVYVSDIGFKVDASGLAPSGTDAIYKVSRNDTVSVFAAGNALLNHPNGLLVLPNGNLQVLSFDPFDGTKEIYVLDRTGARVSTTAMPAGNLDGVVRNHGRLIVSSWATSSLYTVSQSGAISVLATNLPSPADIGLDTRRDRVLVPLFDDNKVVIIPLDD